MTFRYISCHQLLVGTLSLSIAATAGCAVPASPVETVSAPYASPAPGTAPGTPAPVGPVTFQGTVTFAGQPVAGYALQAFDAVTGAALAVSGQATTDAQGRFTVQVPGAVPGQAVRLVAERGEAALEVTLQAAAAPAGYAVRANDEGIALDATSTLLSRLMEGVLQACRILKPEAANPIVSTFIQAMAGHRAALEAEVTHLTLVPGMLTRKLTTDKDRREFDGAASVILSNAVLQQIFIELVATTIQQVAIAIQNPANVPQVMSVGEMQNYFNAIVLRGTQFKLELMGLEMNLRLYNRLTNAVINAASGRISEVTTVRRPSRREEVSAPNPRLVTNPFTAPVLSLFADAVAGVPAFDWPADGNIPSGFVGLPDDGVLHVLDLRTHLAPDWQGPNAVLVPNDPYDLIQLPNGVVGDRHARFYIGDDGTVKEVGLFEMGNETRYPATYLPREGMVGDVFYSISISPAVDDPWDPEAIQYTFGFIGGELISLEENEILDGEIDRTNLFTRNDVGGFFPPL